MGKNYHRPKLKQAIFVGQAPGFDGQEKPLVGRSGKRLEMLCGLSCGQMDSLFDKTNIFKEFPGRQSHPLKGDMFDIKKARMLTKNMKFDNYKLVVFLGLNVAKSFDFIKRPRLFKQFYMTKEDKLSIGIVLPHPSGVSHYWNTKENREKAMKVLRRVMKKTGIGNYSKYFKKQKYKHENVSKYFRHRMSVDDCCKNIIYPQM